MASRAVPPRNAAAPADPDEAHLVERIATAELAGRTTVADALARKLEALRATKTAGVVDLARERERRGR